MPRKLLAKLFLLISIISLGACSDESDTDLSYYAGTFRAGNIVFEKQSSGQLVSSGFDMDFWETVQELDVVLNLYLNKKRALPNNQIKTRSFKRNMRAFQSSLSRLEAQIKNSGKETFIQLSSIEGNIIGAQIIDIDIVEKLILLFEGEIGDLCDKLELYYINQQIPLTKLNQAKDDFFFKLNVVLNISNKERRDFILKHLDID